MLPATAPPPNPPLAADTSEVSVYFSPDPPVSVADSFDPLYSLVGVASCSIFLANFDHNHRKHHSRTTVLGAQFKNLQEAGGECQSTKDQGAFPAGSTSDHEDEGTIEKEPTKDSRSCCFASSSSCFSRSCFTLTHSTLSRSAS